MVKNLAQNRKLASIRWLKSYCDLKFQSLESMKMSNGSEIKAHFENSNGNNLKDWQEYQMSFSKSEAMLYAKAMVMHRHSEDYIKEFVETENQFQLSDAERDLRIKELTSQVSQLEYWCFEALREARRARIYSQIIMLSLMATCLAILIF